MQKVSRKIRGKIELLGIIEKSTVADSNKGMEYDLICISSVINCKANREEINRVKAFLLRYKRT